MLHENLQDAGEIIENILTQPLHVPGARENTSLYDAARNYDPHNPATSDLRKIVLSFLQFPSPTETMLRELDILLEELAES